MKKSKTSIFILIFITISLINIPIAFSDSNSLQMELSFSSPPFVDSMCAFNSKLYAGTGGYSFDEALLYVYDGLTWNLAYDVPNSNQLWDLIEYNDKLYLATGYSGIIYVYDPSSPPGEEWNIAYDAPESAILCLGVYNNKLYAGTSAYAGAIYEYNNGNWNYIYDIPGKHIKCFAVYNGELYVSTEISMFGDEVVIYKYDGENWHLCWSSTDFYAVNCLIAQNNKLYAGCWSYTSNQGTIITFDGTSWSTSFEADGEYFWRFTNHDNKLYASTWSFDSYAKIYALEESGWNLAYEFTDEGETFVRSLASYQNRLYAGTNSNGIYVSQKIMIASTIELVPDTLNLKSKGKWVTVYIELPNGYDLSSIDTNSLLLQEIIPWESSPIQIGDFDEDGIPDLMVKFNRESLQSMLTVDDEVEVTVSGTLNDGTIFSGTDTIRVIDQGNEHFSEDPTSIQ